MLVEHLLKYSRIIIKIIFILLSILSCDSKPIEYNIEDEDAPLITDDKYPPEPSQDKNIPTENIFRYISSTEVQFICICCL